tara:strand:- start:540 stop:872 length:333 start_codon:yes stop_codon:yes gene_type:complete
MTLKVSKAMTAPKDDILAKEELYIVLILMCFKLGYTINLERLGEEMGATEEEYLSVQTDIADPQHSLDIAESAVGMINNLTQHSLFYYDTCSYFVLLSIYLCVYIYIYIF